MTTQTFTLLYNSNRYPITVTTDGDHVLLSSQQLFDISGWELKPVGLCKGGQCVPLGPYKERWGKDYLSLQAFAELQQMPLAIDNNCAALGEAASQRSMAMQSLQAADFELPDLDGKPHRLSDYRGKKILLVAWASWCGCREDLGIWNQLHTELNSQGLEVITIALDSKTADAQPFIEKAAAENPSLIDHQHHTAELYGFINVPSIVWIDEQGMIVRPARVEHASNEFQWVHGLDCEPHMAALRHWVNTGETDMSCAEVKQGLMPPSDDEQLARCHFQLGFYLYQQDNQQAAKQQFEIAEQLSPDDWTIRRGSMWLRDMDPFGQDFFDVWEAWEKQGKPDYISKARQRNTTEQV